MNACFILGGARSGKTEFSENIFSQKKTLYYAAAGDMSEDLVWRERIKACQKRRPSSWTTVEYPSTLQDIIEKSDEFECVVIDCLTLWLSWSLTDALSRYSMDQVHLYMQGEIEQFCKDIQKIKKPLLVISNETGLGVVPSKTNGRIFRDLLGVFNQSVGKIIPSHVFLLSGNPILIKHPKEKILQITNSDFINNILFNY